MRASVIGRSAESGERLKIHAPSREGEGVGVRIAGPTEGDAAAGSRRFATPARRGRNGDGVGASLAEGLQRRFEPTEGEGGAEAAKLKMF
jgi:hypothetical protein